MLINELSYDDDDFAVRARKLITNGQVFSFRIAGQAREQLEPYVVNGSVAVSTRLGLKPKLQALLAILMLAEASERAISFEVQSDMIRVFVGVIKA